MAVVDRAMAWVAATVESARRWHRAAHEFLRSRRARKIGLITAVVIAVYGLSAFIGVPMLVRHIVTGQVAISLHRPVTVGKIGFNPYTLRLDVDQLHIGDRDGQKPFVDLGHLAIKVSWSSIFRIAPVIGVFEIDRPEIHLVRSAEQTFNFSDLLGAPGQPPPPPKPAPAAAAKPPRFAVSNIQIRDGAVWFDDQVMGKQHTVEHIQIGVPFIASLPSDVDIFVKPLLAMSIDGSQFRLAGRTKPFGTSLESILDLKLDQLDLTKYIGYAPIKLPVGIPHGMLSTSLEVHFVQTQPAPSVSITGRVALDDIDVRDSANEPLVGLKHFLVRLLDVQPLRQIIHLRAINIDGLDCHAVLNRDGTLNFASLAAPGAAPAAVAPAAPEAAPTAQPTARAAPAASPLDASVESFDLSNSSVEFTDNRGAKPAAAAIQDIHVGLKGLRTIGSPPASFDMNAKLSGGGTLKLDGTVDLVQSHARTDIAIDQVDLPALQPFAQANLAANIASGKLSTHATVDANFAPSQFNVHVEPASLALENLDVRPPTGRDKAVAFTRLGVTVGKVDLAAHQATVNEVRLDGLDMFVRRGSRGELNLLSLVRTPAAPAPAAPAAKRRRKAARKGQPAPPASPPPTPASAPAAPWQFQVASVALEKSAIRFEDHTVASAANLTVAPMNLHLKDVSSDFAKPIGVDLDGTLNRKGGFKIAGTAAVNPLKATLHITTDRLGLEAAAPYVESNLNATIRRAALTTKGDFDMAIDHGNLRVGYRGDATVGNVEVLDKLTSDSFLSWKAFGARRIDFAYGGGAPKVHIGALSLADFYARIILNRDGKLNLSDITASPQAPPTSLTRPEAAASAPAPAQPPAPAAAPSAGAPAAAPSAAPIKADIAIGRITLSGGKVNYSDYFIKPNYSADLSEIEGKVGAFGTSTTTPAPVTVDGKVEGSAPINIDGSINPLAPMAFVDIRAKADGIELTGLSPYTTKYTGYPIVKGTLTMDVHYLLDQDKLTAENKILIDQFTFGDRVESPSATNLPVRLAISLLKDSQGRINLDVPVSGSLSDPQFSIGGVIWGVIKNLIMKAVTSPFSLLASVVGGSSAELGYIEFRPGFSTLTSQSQAKLATVAKVLQDKPSLNLDICGRVDPAVDRDGLRDTMVARLVAAQMIEATGRGGTAPEDIIVDETSSDYNKYLTRAYKAADIPGKPRNVIGLAQTLPPDEMKKLLLANMKVTDQDLPKLAQARANAVRKWLSDNKVDPGKLFTVPPKLTAEGITDKGKTSRVDLSLK